jgi:hypothetical protein
MIASQAPIWPTSVFGRLFDLSIVPVHAFHPIQ